MANTFLHALNELHYGTYKPEDVEPALDQTEQLAQKRIAAIVAMAEPRTFENTVLAITRATDEFEAVCSIVHSLSSVLGGVWEEPMALASKRSAQLSNELSLDEHIYQALKAVGDQTDYVKKLSQPAQKFLRELLRDYRRGGVDLPAEQKVQLKQLNAELSDLTTVFNQNLLKVNDNAGLHVASESELAGLDHEFIATCRAAAADRKQDGYWIAYNEPNYAKVLRLCSHRPTRAGLYKAANTRAAALNTDIAQKILQLRAQRARLLGHKSHAHYVLETRMAKNPETAIRFIDDLSLRYCDQAVQEADAVLQFARQHEGQPDMQLDIWEIDSGLDFYYANLLREKTCDFNEEQLREYFPLAVVRDGMFETLSTLYGVRFVRVTEAAAWHTDVEVYDIFDSQQHHLARVWCDWLARPGKRGGAWMNSHYTAERANGTFDKPHLGYVVCNAPVPTATKPSLLSIRDVETIWHEFGHFMHFALGKTDLPEQSMMGCVWDFVEAPSQIMENWVWQPSILQRISHHYKTGEALPDDLMTRVLSSRQFRVASKTMRQLNYSSIDLLLHTNYDPNGPVGILQQSRITKQLFVPPTIKVPDFEAAITNFSHIFGGGYSAAYYSYKWAEAIEADLFSRFAAEGVLNQATGQAYANTILAHGDDEEPAVLIRNFLGRDTTIEAMLARDGISAARTASSADTNQPG